MEAVRKRRALWISLSAASLLLYPGVISAAAATQEKAPPPTTPAQTRDDFDQASVVADFAV